MSAESSDAVLSRIDERTKITAEAVTLQGRKMDDLRQHLDTNFVTKDTLGVLNNHLGSLGSHVGSIKTDCTREVESLRGELAEVRSDLNKNYATCDRVSSLEDVLGTETAAKLKELVESDEPEKRAVVRGDINVMQKLVYGVVALVLTAVVVAAMALIIRAPK